MIRLPVDAILTAAFFALVACASYDPLGPKDLNGYTYPTACAGSLEGVVPDPIFVSRSELHALIDSTKGGSVRRAGRPIDGWYVHPFGRPPQIYINSALSGAVLEAVLRHERCHARMDELTGSSHWHPDGAQL